MFIKNKKGFTLIELVLVVSILSIFILVSSNAILLMFKSHSQTYGEYDLQSSARIISKQVGETIKYSQAVFAVPIEYVEDVNKMDPEWEFIALSPDKRSVLNYKYNTSLGQHEATVLLAPQDNIEYEIIFEKRSASEEVVGGETVFHNESVLYYSILAHSLIKNDEGNWVRGSQKIVMESEVKALNALQVVDKGTALSPAVALAYRKDDQTYGEGRSHVVKVALILDRSGSMDWIPGVDNDTSGTSRMTYLKKALIGGGLNGQSGMIAQFAVYPNFEISIVPFSNRAQSFINSTTGQPFFNAQLNKADIVSIINNLSASGSTNTGDGIRRAFYNLKNFSVSGYNSNVEEHDFTIILVDGDSNAFSYSDYTEDGYNIWPWGWIVTDRNYNYILDSDIYYNDTSSTWRTDESGFGYVSRIGQKIITEENYDGTYYLIGYVNDENSAGVENIRQALNIPEDRKFMYSDPNFDLNEVFANIATDIMAKTWLVTGPQINDGGEE